MLKKTLRNCCTALFSSARGETEHIRMRKDEESRGGKRDAVGNSRLGVVQTREPLLAGKGCRHRKIAKADQRKRQPAADQRCDKRVFEQIGEAEPQRYGCEQLRIAAA